MVDNLTLVCIPRNQLRYRRTLFTSIYPPYIRGVIDYEGSKMDYVVKVTWL
jgi:hypothetical protein